MYEVTCIKTMQITDIIQVESLENLRSPEDASRIAVRSYKATYGSDNVSATVQYFPREIETRSEKQDA